MESGFPISRSRFLQHLVYPQSQEVTDPDLAEGNLENESLRAGEDPDVVVRIWQFVTGDAMQQVRAYYASRLPEAELTDSGEYDPVPLDIARRESYLHITFTDIPPNAQTIPDEYAGDHEQERLEVDLTLLKGDRVLISLEETVFLDYTAAHK